MQGPWLSSLVGLLIITGEIVGGLLAKKIRYLKWQCVVSIFLGGLFFALVATCNPDTRARACAFVALGVFFLGWAESVSISLVTLTARHQDELGTASGIAGSTRFLIASIAATVYTVILTQETAKKVPPRVTAAVEEAGLSASAAQSFLAALTGGTSSALEQVPGITDSIIATGTRAYQDASASAYGVVFLSTIAWTAVGVIATLVLPNVDHLLTEQVAATLGRGKNEKTDARENA